MNVSFEINEKEYQIPDYLTIEKYVKIYKVKDIFADDYFGAKMINIVSDAPLEELLQANFQEIRYLSNYITLLFPTEPKFEQRFELDGVHYGFLPHWRDISFAEFIDLDTLLNKKPEEILDYIHIITAIMYRPIIEEGKDGKFKIEKYNADTMVERAEIFKKRLDIKYFIGSQFFFLQFAKKYTEASLQFSTMTQKEKLKWMWKNRKILVQLLLRKDSDGWLHSTEFATMILQNTMKSSKRSWWKSLTTLPTWLRKTSI